MRTILAAILALLAPAALAYRTTGETGEGNGATFSEAFRNAYTAATVDETKPVAIEDLLLMRSKFTKPEEVAELELTMGVIYGQRPGMVDHKKAVPHFTKALKHELPATVRTKVLVWRGNALESQKRVRAALPDYIRGLMLCTQFDLSHGWPKDPPRLKEDPRPETGVDPAALEGRRTGPGKSGADALTQSRLLRIERQMIMHRYFLVEAVKRIAKGEKLDAVDIEREIAFIVTDERRATQILEWIRDKNERPWK